ncbi:MAG: GAF domain-containing protein [Chloroflexi bacterium]|nr:GAF domain-containing protein [Chloroflexota bacterium]
MLGTGPLESSPDLKETVARLRRLVDLGTTLNSTLNLNDLLKLIIQTAADVLECEATSILLYNEQRSRLFFAAATGEDVDKLSEIPVPIDNSIAGTIFSTGEPLILNAIEGDPRHNAQASEHVGFRTESLLGVPLRIRDKTIGVLEALNKKVGPFSDADKNLLIVVASHAAVAIHNAQLVKALKQAYEDVTKADQLKSNFLALASHELRTPLGIIIGYATFLREESEGQNSEHAEQVLNAAMQMRTLLEDMNNLTMLEAETSSVVINKVLLQDVLEAVADEVEELAQIKRQIITFEFPEEPLNMLLDEKKFKTAVVNLFHNAIRFSPEKGKIVVGAEREKENILVWVKDYGIGIPKKELEDIFEKFYQVEAPNVRRYGGMGIGLTIAQGLIKEQGGQLWAESGGEGKGAVFKLTLPFKAA